MHIICILYAVIMQSLYSHYAVIMHIICIAIRDWGFVWKQRLNNGLSRPYTCSVGERRVVVCDVLATCHRWKITFDTHNLFLISRPHHTLLGNHIANNITIRSHASLRPELSLRMNKVWVSVHSAQFTTNGRPQVYVLLQDSSPIQVQERFTTSSLQGGHTEEWIS